MFAISTVKAAFRLAFDSIVLLHGSRICTSFMQLDVSVVWPALPSANYSGFLREGGVQYYVKMSL